MNFGTIAFERRKAIFGNQLQRLSKSRHNTSKKHSHSNGEATDQNMPEGQPKSMKRPSQWSDEVEEAYRFQIAGYRDAIEYMEVQKKEADRWPHNGYVKKLVRRDGCFYYYNKARECPDKEIHKTKIYAY